MARYFFKSKLSKPVKYGLLFTTTILLIIAASAMNWAGLFQPLQDFIFTQEESYEQWLKQQTTNNLLLLLVFAFIGGLIASISPCKLALLTVNLSYIGTREITCRTDAFFKATAFVLGVVTVLSLFGLVSSFAGAVIVDYRGYVNIAVAMIMLFMGLNLAGILRLPNLPKIKCLSLPSLPLLSPYSVGLSFALVGSPCASPVLISVLSAAAATGNQFHSVLTMVSYALGNTVVIFLASVCAGLATQTRALLKYSDVIMRLASGLLIIVGGYYLITGIRWLILSI